jgi:hypothetical protein
MTEQKVYIGSQGPYLYDDADDVADSDGDFSGQKFRGIVTNQMAASESPVEDEEVLRALDGDVDNGSLVVLIEDNEFMLFFNGLI